MTVAVDDTHPSIDPGLDHDAIKAEGREDPTWDANKADGREKDTIDADGQSVVGRVVTVVAPEGDGEPYPVKHDDQCRLIHRVHSECSALTGSRRKKNERDGGCKAV
jgi:hypothetical protein